MNEVRYYLELIQMSMCDCDEPFKPTYIVTATKLPSGGIELAVNTTAIPAKIEYILDSYDEQMRLKTNPEVVMQNIMVV